MFVWSRLHGQCFQTRWKAPEFTKLLVLQGVFAKVTLDNADPAGYSAEFVLARVAGEWGGITSVGVAPNSQGRGFSVKVLCAAEAQFRKMSAPNLFPKVAEMNE